MKKYFFTSLVGLLCFACLADAQVGVFVGPGFGYGPGYGRPPYARRRVQNLPPFKPTVNISFGYGFPNLDKYALAQFNNMYQGNTTTQLGPITGAVDYRFSRMMSIGVLVTHGKVSAPFYYYNAPATPALTGSLDNWSVMLNFVRYLSAGDRVAPYIRTAIGVNTWQQNYSDGQGNKLNLGGTPDELAYQVGLGADFYLAKNAGLFIEGGYGKYILQGGLAFRF